jgi:hypothetical protein
LLAWSAAAQPSLGNQPDFRLQVVPAIVYKVDDPGNARTSTFVFNIAVICSTDCELTPISAHVELLSAGSIVERQEWKTEMLAKIKNENYRLLFNLPEAFDLRFYYRCHQALAIDSANVRITVADAKGRRAEQMLSIPVQYYHQKTSLIFPFRGRGVVGQDWITNGGHGGYAPVILTDFAIDVRGLDQNWAEQKSDSDENSAAVGWGREIIAPAAGTVTYARNDVPDNPRQGEPDMATLASLHDPSMAGLGNCVVIDHGNSEYSVLMHMQQGSVTVKVGDRVAAGQVIGKLGNSGGAFGPHLHYQLQSGPQPGRDQTLPFKFQNVNPLFRGRQFDAK